MAQDIVQTSDVPVIELRNIGVRFDSYVVHKNISLKFGKAETVTILGPSGTGKTILLKLIIGLLAPTSGQVLFKGVPLISLKERELREIRRNIGMLFQGAALFDSLSVFENVAYALREFGETSEEKIAQIVHEKLEIIGLGGVSAKFPSQLSGGQKKRVGLARALALAPAVMLFDEPTTGLDPTAARLIDALIVKLRDEMGITCIVVTHDIASARRISDRWVLLNKGQVVADGAVEELANSNQKVIEFITGNVGSEITGVEVNGAD